jgi:hypothetical protein
MKQTYGLCKPKRKKLVITSNLVLRRLKKSLRLNNLVMRVFCNVHVASPLFLTLGPEIKYS